VFLPCEAALPSGSNAHAADVETEVNGQSAVLVVDDEETVRQVTGAMLERFGYRVLLANDGAEGVKMYERHAPAVAAVLLDLTMPVMSGEEAYRKILEIDPEARVLVMSGFNESDAVERFGGADVEFIQKPFKPNSLKAKLGLLTGRAANGV
jgi:CheY-like chemotaxis protein